MKIWRKREYGRSDEHYVDIYVLVGGGEGELKNVKISVKFMIQIVLDKS